MVVTNPRVVHLADNLIVLLWICRNFSVSGDLQYCGWRGTIENAFYIQLNHLAGESIGIQSAVEAVGGSSNQETIYRVKFKSLKLFELYLAQEGIRCIAN
ncbi:hypothetical protein C9I89_21315 [Photobacterium lipolyticum]|uniref:Uncharacterized protein n=1 Tax=Photobacterium lipolyticum TaxID=266810 RepID=A0A2T3MS59_9GAMM|nr:hypothetical protein C9I89_21315 [Photobacterium lipolyticum]